MWDMKGDDVENYFLDAPDSFDQNAETELILQPQSPQTQLNPFSFS